MRKIGQGVGSGICGVPQVAVLRDLCIRGAGRHRSASTPTRGTQSVLAPTIGMVMLCFIAVVSSAAAETSDVKLTVGANAVQVQIVGQPFTVYHFAGDAASPLVRPYFYPILATDGTPLTSDQMITNPKEHPHHRSMWVGMGSVNGLDHWSFQQKPAPPHQRHVRFESVAADSLVQDLVWEDLAAKPLLNETRTIGFVAYPDGSRAIDLTIALTAAGQDVTLGDTKEAGLCAIRVASQISKHPTLTNSHGDNGEKKVWGKPADWVDESGTIVAILDSPTNLRYPTPWHAREYGLLAPNEFGLHVFDPKLPAGAGDVKIANGQTMTFRYRAVFHPGDAEAAKIGEKYGAFVKVLGGK